MIELTLGEVAAIVGGRLRDADPATPSSTGAVEFDSRQVGPAGCSSRCPASTSTGTTTSHAAIARGRGRGASSPARSTAPRIEVADGVDRAGRAGHARSPRRLPDVTVVGVTGSSGKTSTKDLLAQRARRGSARRSRRAGSFNNELGHPYTVLRADARRPASSCSRSAPAGSATSAT